MKQFKNWFTKKNINLSDCSSFEVTKEQSSELFGGFKEYKPPIYEHESAVSTKISISDLFLEVNRNHPQ